MFKQILFSAVAVMLVSQAYAGEAGKIDAHDGKSQDQALKEDRVKEASTARTSKELIRANASKKLDQYLGSVLDAKDKQVILDLAIQDKVVARALLELVNSKKADKTGANAMIDDAQTTALQVLAKIPNLQERIKNSDLTKGDDKLTHSERQVYNLIVRVPSKARTDWAKGEKDTAAQAIKILGEEARSKSLDEAINETVRRMNINKDALEKLCS